MEKEQEREWQEAQNIELSVDLVEAAKTQLEFLAVVDRNRQLYEGPALERAIFRYNAFWLPLLAKHTANPLCEEPLVVPFDCEWVWHCHRLNPIQYKSDCVKLFGRILGADKVISSVKGASKKRTEEIWKTMYPEESYEPEQNSDFSRDLFSGSSRNETFISYDLVSAATRYQDPICQMTSFFKKGITRFCVPTYDIDLIWHSHQLHPDSYCGDLIRIAGKVVGHDDTVTDRTKGKKLDNGFSETVKQWEETFGLRYWKAGGMYRGNPPTPVTNIPLSFDSEGEKLHQTSNCENIPQFRAVQAVEVLLEFVDIKNLPEDDQKGNLFVTISKKQPDKIFNTKRTISIFSEPGKKDLTILKCEATGEFLIELVSHSPSNLAEPKFLGSYSLSLQELLASSNVQLFANKWLSVVPISDTTISHPNLYVSISFTIPTPVLQDYHLVESPECSKCQHAKSRTRVTDDDGNDIIFLQMSKEMKNAPDELLKEVHFITKTGERHILASCAANEWSMKDTYGSFKLRSSSGNNGALFELLGDKMIKIYPGRRLEYEPKQYEKGRSEREFLTAVEFSSQCPYGRAVALIDFKCRTLKVEDEWMVLPAITLAFILFDTLKIEEHNTFTFKDNTKKVEDQVVTLPETKYNKMEKQEEMNFKPGCLAVCVIINEISAFNTNTENKIESSIGVSGGAGCGPGCGIKEEAAIGGSGGADCGAGCGIKREALIGVSGGAGCGPGCGIMGEVVVEDCGGALCAGCGVKHEGFIGDDSGGSYCRAGDCGIGFAIENGATTTIDCDDGNCGLGNTEKSASCGDISLPPSSVVNKLIAA